MGKYVNFNLDEYRQFFTKLSKAAKGDFKRELGLFLESVGYEFLKRVEEEIIARNVMDSRLLLTSFHKGSEDGVWLLDMGDLVLEVGTNLKYAGYVNDGHWTNEKGQSGRWVPGRWEGDRFIYEPGAETGMYLKQKWVPGKHYFDSALNAFDKVYQASLEAKLQQWIDEYFRA